MSIAAVTLLISLTCCRYAAKRATHCRSGNNSYFFNSFENCGAAVYTANTRRWPNARLMIRRPRRERANINTSFVQRLVFAGWAVAMTSTSRLWIAVLFLPEKINVFEHGGERERSWHKAPKKLFINCAKNKLSMRSRSWNVTDSKKHYFRPDYLTPSLRYDRSKKCFTILYGVNLWQADTMGLLNSSPEAALNSVTAFGRLPNFRCDIGLYISLFVLVKYIVQCPAKIGIQVTLKTIINLRVLVTVQPDKHEMAGSMLAHRLRRWHTTELVLCLMG